MPWTRDSTMAWPRPGISFGRPTARRTAMTSTRATNQLVTMLLVTGRGPILNRAWADVSTPAANAGTPFVRDAKTIANLVTRDMFRCDGWNALKRLVVGNGPPFGQQPKR